MPHPSNPYSVHPSLAMVRTWIDILPAKTGRSLEAALPRPGSGALEAYEMDA